MSLKHTCVKCGGEMGCIGARYLDKNTPFSAQFLCIPCDRDTLVNYDESGEACEVAEKYGAGTSFPGGRVV